jgi:hypothetical protein
MSSRATVDQATKTIEVKLARLDPKQIAVPTGDDSGRIPVGLQKAVCASF